jgi:hypothetical protein
VVVASSAIASFILSAGPRHCERFRLRLHATLELALGAAADLSQSAPPVSRSRDRRGRRPKPVWSRPPPGLGGRGLIPLPRPPSGEPLLPPRAVQSSVPSPFKEDASDAAPSLPYVVVHPSSPRSLEPNAATNGKQVSPVCGLAGGINAPDLTPPLSYLEAARRAPASTPKTPPLLSKP